MTLVAVFQIVGVPVGAVSGSLNCGPAAAATLVAWATDGKQRPAAWEVRAYIRNSDGSPDRQGGTNLRQQAEAMQRGYDVVMQVVTPEKFTAFRERMKADKKLAASVSVGYGAFIGTQAYASRTGFRSNHQVAVRWVGGTLPWEMVDPLADGRGVPLAPIRISDALLRKAAGELVINEHVGKRLGLGSVYCGYVSAPKTEPAPKRFSVKFGTKAFFRYGVQGGVAIGRTSVRFRRATSAPSTPLQRVPFGGQGRQMVQLTAGAMKGQFVEPGRSGLTLLEA